MVLRGCKMFPNHLTVHLVVCEIFLCRKSSKYPRVAPAPVISVKYPTVCVTRLCCFSLARLTLWGRWSPLPSHCRTAAACLSSWTREAREHCAPSTTTRHIWIDTLRTVAGYLLNKHAAKVQAQSLVCKTPRYPHSAGQPTSDANDAQALRPDLLSAPFRQSREVPHQAHLPWTSEHPAACLSLRSMSLSGKLCSGWESKSAAGNSNWKTLILFCSVVSFECLLMYAVQFIVCHRSTTSFLSVCLVYAVPRVSICRKAVFISGRT